MDSEVEQLQVTHDNHRDFGFSFPHTGSVSAGLTGTAAAHGRRLTVAEGGRDSIATRVSPGRREGASLKS